MSGLPALLWSADSVSWNGIVSEEMGAPGVVSADGTVLIHFLDYLVQCQKRLVICEQKVVEVVEFQREFEKPKENVGNVFFDVHCVRNEKDVVKVFHFFDYLGLIVTVREYTFKWYDSKLPEIKCL